MNLQEKQEQGLRKNNQWLWAIIFILLSTVILEALFLLDVFQKQVEFTPQITASKQNICNKPKPTSGNFIHVQAYFNADDIAVREFVWDNIDYARSCFPTTDNKHSFDAYLPFDPGKKSSFSSVILTDEANTKIEYSIKVYDLNDKLIAQFPETVDPGIYPINSPGEVMQVRGTIKL